MANKKVTLEQLPSAISAILDEYAGDIARNIPEITEKIGKTGVKAVKAGAKAKFNGKKYAAGWTQITERSRFGASTTIYNSRLPGLPHLLEHGHANRGGGRTEGRAHILPVEEKLIKQYEEKIINDITRNS